MVSVFANLILRGILLLLGMVWSSNAEGDWSRALFSSPRPSSSSSWIPSDVPSDPPSWGPIARPSRPPHLAPSSLPSSSPTVPTRPFVALNQVVGTTYGTDVEFMEILSRHPNTLLSGISLIIVQSYGDAIGTVLQHFDFSAQGRQLTTGCNGKFLLGYPPLIQQYYRKPVNYPIPPNYIVNAPYTVALLPTAQVPPSGVWQGNESYYDAVFVTDQSDPVGTRGNLARAVQVGPDLARNASLPAGFRRTPDGSDHWVLADFAIVGNHPRPGRRPCSPTAAPSAAEPYVYSIHEIQGTGAASPLVGRKVSTKGIVTMDAQNWDADPRLNLGGFFLQTVPGEEDRNPLTSEGIFVDDTSMTTPVHVEQGDVVYVTGYVQENDFFMTLLFNVISIQRVQTGQPLPAYTVVNLSNLTKYTFNADNQTQPDLEQYEGMMIALSGTMTMVDQALVDRFNQVEVYAGATTRPQAYTQTNTPGGGYDAFEVDQGRFRIAFDDGLATQYAGPSYIEGFSPYTTANAPRLGDTFSTLNGVLHQDFAGSLAVGGNARWRIRGNRDSNATAVSKTPRPAQPIIFYSNRDKKYKRKVCNVLLQHYFISLNSGGANDANELARQQAKIVTALVEMDCDILAMEEFENVFALGASTAAPLTVLATALNADSRVTDKTYTAVYPGVNALPGEFSTAAGFIIKTSRVKVLGTPFILDFKDGKNNPTVVVTFQWASGLLGLKKSCANFAVNSFKSKSGICTGDPRFPDGSGACDRDRQRAATLLVSQMALDLTGGRCAGKHILMGKFNAAAAEPPISIIKNAGYVSAVSAGSHYDYIFDFKTVSLGYVFSKGITVAAGAVWHINADEAPVLDYNTDNPGRDPSIFDATSPARYSDFDPMVIKI